MKKVLSRRESLGMFATFGGLVLGCGGVSAAASDAGSSSDGGATGDTGLGDADTPWAQGGTKSMTGTYADPFPTAVASCVLAHAVTEGPCTEVFDRVRFIIPAGDVPQ